MLMPDLLLALLLALFGVFCVCLLFLAVCALFVTKKEYTHNSRFYRALLCRSSAFALWFLRVHVHVSGTELLPQNGRLLFVGNHRSNFDPIIQWTVLPQWEIAFISKEGNFRIPFFGRFIRKCCFLSIDRSSPKRSVETMRQGGAAARQRRGLCRRLPGGNTEQERRAAAVSLRYVQNSAESRSANRGNGNTRHRTDTQKCSSQAHRRLS